MATTRTKVAVDEVERMGKDRVDRGRLMTRNDTAQIVAKTGTLVNFVGKKVPRAKVTVERAARPCSKRTLKLNVVSGRKSVCTVPRLMIGPGIVPRIVPASSRVRDVAGETASTAKWAMTSGVPPGYRDAGKSQKGKGTDEQGNPARLPAQPGPSGALAKPAAGRETQG